VTWYLGSCQRYSRVVKLLPKALFKLPYTLDNVSGHDNPKLLALPSLI
jgi:hypothetical protein